MAYEQKDNSGSLFRNDDKQSDNHPDYNGSGMIEGKQFWISAWVKTAKNGKKFFSLSFKPKDFAQKSNKSIQEDMDGDSIPF